jgi:hypothetical protein
MASKYSARGAQNLFDNRNVPELHSKRYVPFEPRKQRLTRQRGFSRHFIGAEMNQAVDKQQI